MRLLFALFIIGTQSAFSMTAPVYSNDPTSLKDYISQEDFDNFYERFRCLCDNYEERFLANSHRVEPLREDEFDSVAFYVRSPELTPAIAGYIAVELKGNANIDGVRNVAYIPHATPAHNPSELPFNKCCAPRIRSDKDEMQQSLLRQIILLKAAQSGSEYAAFFFGFLGAAAGHAATKVLHRWYGLGTFHLISISANYAIFKSFQYLGSIVNETSHLYLSKTAHKIDVLNAMAAEYRNELSAYMKQLLTQGYNFAIPTGVGLAASFLTYLAYRSYFPVEAEKCGICLDVLTNPNLNLLTNCQHAGAFCGACLLQALQVHNACPLCRERGNI